MKLNSLTDPAIQAIIAARVSILFDSPDHGRLATGLELVEVEYRNGLYADTGQLKFNRNFALGLTTSELVNALRHQIKLLCATKHVGSTKPRL